MQVESIVETVGNFEDIRKIWGLPYPYKGDILTVSAITKHRNKQVSNKGIVLLHFHELPNLPGVCDKQINGKLNFIEILTQKEIKSIEKIIEEEFTLEKV